MMMKYVAAVTKPAGVPTIVSLNTIMIEGTGMCGGCRVEINNQVQFVCVDGPEFDAHRVDWNSLLERLAYYREEERLAAENWKDHACRLDLALINGIGD